MRRVKYVICGSVVFLVPMAMFAGSANVVRPVLLPERLTPGNVNIRPIQPIDSADWIWGVDDAKWRTDAAWLRARFPGLVLTVEGLRNFETRGGLVANLSGWSFQDWTAWPRGAYAGG